MRQKKAKALRRADRPNPGRKHGGSGKVMKTEPETMKPPPVTKVKKMRHG